MCLASIRRAVKWQGVAVGWCVRSHAAPAKMPGPPDGELEMMS